MMRDTASANGLRVMLIARPPPPPPSLQGDLTSVPSGQWVAYEDVSHVSNGAYETDYSLACMRERSCMTASG